MRLAGGTIRKSSGGTLADAGRVSKLSKRSRPSGLTIRGLASDELADAPLRHDCVLNKNVSCCSEPSSLAWIQYPEFGIVEIVLYGFPYDFDLLSHNYGSYPRFELVFA